MRVLARIGYTLAGLALLAPAAARAGMPVPANTQAKVKKKSVKAPKKLCAVCQYKKMLAQGLRVPPPPPLPAGSPVRGEQCGECGALTAVVSSGKLYRSDAAMVVADSTPGRAVVGGPAEYMAAAGEPTPIGAVAPRFAAAAPTSLAPGAGPRDSAVMPTSMASDPITPGPSRRPHVLSHLFGVSAIGRDWSERRERAKEEKHAMIPYGPQAAPVTDVPASLVYGRR